MPSGSLGQGKEVLPLGRLVFVLAWAFVFVAAAYDARFAWDSRDVIASWEVNPLARWLAAHCGLAAVLALKFAGLAFAACVAGYYGRRGKRAAWALTVVVVGAYAWLLLHYHLDSREAAQRPVAAWPPGRSSRRDEPGPRRAGDVSREGPGRPRFGPLLPGRRPP
jgi:hypothetical protein